MGFVQISNCHSAASNVICQGCFLGKPVDAKDKAGSAPHVIAQHEDVGHIFCVS